MVTYKIGNNLGVSFPVLVIIISTLLCFIRDVIILSILDRVTGWLEIILAARIRNQGKDIRVGGRPKGYFDFFEEKTTYVADWLMVKLETSPTRMLCSVDDDLGKTGNWVFQGNLPVSAMCMAASTPNFPFVLQDWTFQTKKIELSNGPWV